MSRTGAMALALLLAGRGASAELPSAAGTHYDAGDAAAADPVDRPSSRPDFLVLCYAVITLKAPVTHAGSHDNLLGQDPDPASLWPRLCAAWLDAMGFLRKR